MMMNKIFVVALVAFVMSVSPAFALITVDIHVLVNGSLAQNQSFCLNSPINFTGTSNSSLGYHATEGFPILDFSWDGGASAEYYDQYNPFVFVIRPQFELGLFDSGNIANGMDVTPRTTSDFVYAPSQGATTHIILYDNASCHPPSQTHMWFNGTDGNQTLCLMDMQNFTFGNSLVNELTLFNVYDSDGVTLLAPYALDNYPYEGYASFYFTIDTFEYNSLGYDQLGLLRFEALSNNSADSYFINVINDSSCYPVLPAPVQTTGMLIADAGVGFGNFIEAIQSPVVNFVLVLGIIGGILSIFVAIAYVVKTALF